ASTRTSTSNSRAKPTCTRTARLTERASDDLELLDYPLLVLGGAAPFLHPVVLPDRLHVGLGEAGDADAVGDEARDDRGVEDVGGAEGAEQERAALAEARACLGPQPEDADDVGARLVGQV